MLAVPRIYVAILAIAFGVGAGSAYAAPNPNEFKLPAKNGKENDGLGWSVAVSGNKAVVGSNFGNVVYFFTRNGAKWSQQGKVEGGTNFGGKVAISGNTAVVGGFGNATVFALRGAEWVQREVLQVPGATNAFGRALAISGDTIIAGDGLVHDGLGAVHIFVRNVREEWILQETITPTRRPPPSQFGDSFGSSVAISGETAIVGAPFANVVGDGLYQKGSAYVYVRNGVVWEEQAYLTAGTEPSFNFGNSVAISGNKAIVGSGVTGDAAYVFERNGAVWSASRVLREGLSGAHFGESVAISGEKIVVGAYGTDKFQGAAYVFERGDGTWPLKQKLQASDPSPPNPSPSSGGNVDASFGRSVDVSGETIIVGTPSKKIGSNLRQGRAYVIQQPDTDGDGLPDEWEKNGITIEGEFLDLKAMGANPMHKDIFIHADWMLHPNDSGLFPLPLHPNPQSIKKVIEAFKAAPVENPDKKPGITLHIDLGPDSVMDPVTGKKWTETYSKVTQPIPFSEITGSMEEGGYRWIDTDFYKKHNFEPSKRRPVFHWVVFGNALPISLPAHGIARGTPGADMVVAGGALRKALQEDQPDLVNTFYNDAFDRVWSDWVAATLMHELGHTLGLKHGGHDEVNRKPNYLSLMNYVFYPTGVPQQKKDIFKLDYSRLTLKDLNENHLVEALGIQDREGHRTLFNAYRADLPDRSNKCLQTNYNTRFLPALDWDCNGAITQHPVRADINGDSICVFAKGPLPLQTVPAPEDILQEGIIFAGADRICSTAALTDAAGELLDVQYTPVSNRAAPLILMGFNDWKNLDYGAGGQKGQRYAALIPQPMATISDEQPIKNIMVTIPPGLIKALVIAPRDVVTVSPAEGEPPLVVTFDGTASFAFDGKIVKWEWDFGDNNTGSGQTVTHTYTRPGQYFATLAVTDDKGRVNTSPHLNLVNVAGEIQLTPGDLNGDNVVDLIDLDILTAELDTPATEPSDPHDLNGDGTIDALDARILVNLCTYSRCASSKQD
jgi:hypothetical protein